jgi:hypothetical protein
MVTILRFILFFLLAPAFSIVAQAIGSAQDDFRIVDIGLWTESLILDSNEGQICSYDSRGALLQQRKSQDGESARSMAYVASTGKQCLCP